MHVPISTKYEKKKKKRRVLNRKVVDKIPPLKTRWRSMCVAACAACAAGAALPHLIEFFRYKSDVYAPYIPCI